MADTPEQRDDEGGPELDLVGHRGDTTPTEEAREAQQDVPVDVDEWRERDRERGTDEGEYV